MARTDTITYAVQKHLAEHYIERTFCALDLHQVAIANGKPTAGIHHAMQSLIKRNLVECCGTIRNTNGGAPINIYRIIDAENIAAEHVKKSSTDHQREARERMQRMNIAALNLQYALGIGCHG